MLVALRLGGFAGAAAAEGDADPGAAPAVSCAGADAATNAVKTTKTQKFCFVVP